MTAAETPFERNARLLEQLHAAKKAYTGPRERYKDMLGDPAISHLVNELVLANESWIRQIIGGERRRLHWTESTEELFSLVLTGGDFSDKADARGVIGAVLRFDLDRFPSKAFLPSIREAVHNALVRTPKQQKTYLAVHTRTIPAASMDEERNVADHYFVDRRERPPDALAEDRELLELLRDAVKYLPVERRPVARFIIDYSLENGHRPTTDEVAKAQNPPVTRARGQQLVADVLDRLQQIISDHYLQLAEEGVNGWYGFKRGIAAGERAPADAGRER